MQCSYIIHNFGSTSGSKKVACPSHAHEGIPSNYDPDELVFYCSHHRRVVEAKLTWKGTEYNEKNELPRPKV